MSKSSPSRGSAIRLLVIIVVLGGAAAAFMLYQRQATLQGGEDRMKLYDDALQWRLTFKQLLPKGPPDAFKRLQISIRRDDSDAGDHSIEIAGSVEDQAAMDTLKALLVTKKPPARHTVNVSIVPTPALTPEEQELINQQIKDAAAKQPTGEPTEPVATPPK